jgi:hypothetical protein
VTESGVDLSALSGLVDQVCSQGAGCRLGLFEAEANQGALAVARDLTHHFATANKTALLVQLRRDDADGLAQDLPLGAARDGRLRGASFLADSDAPNLEMRQIGAAKAFLVRPRSFDSAPLNGSDGFWANAAAVAAVTVVTAPPLLQSDAGLAVARHLDGVVLSVSATQGSVRAALYAVHALTRARANLLGLVYTDADPTLAKIERFWPSWAA